MNRKKKYMKRKKLNRILIEKNRINRNNKIKQNMNRK